MDPTVRPKLVPVRRVVYHLLPAADKELDKLLEEGVIVPVTEPKPWLMAMRPFPKPKKPGEMIKYSRLAASRVNCEIGRTETTFFGLKLSKGE